MEKLSPLSLRPPRVGRIRYINSDPVYYALETGQVGTFNLEYGAPAELNRKIREGELDIGPVSSVEYARRHHEYLLLPDLSISAFGPVGSVFFMSRVPVSELAGRPVWVTHESETARELLRLLVGDTVSHPPVYVPTAVTRERIRREKPLAALIIGDTALRMAESDEFAHRLDLAEWWRERTRLGFVFAVWVVRRSFAQARPRDVDQVHKALLESKRLTRLAMDAAAREAALRSNLDRKIVIEYFHQLRFDLGPDLLEGLTAFYRRLSSKGVVEGRVPLRFFQADPAGRELSSRVPFGFASPSLRAASSGKSSVSRKAVV